MKARRMRFDIRRQGKPILVGLVVLILANTLAWAILVRPKVSEHFDRTEKGGTEEQKELLKYREEILGGEAYVAGLGKAEEDWRYLRTEILSTRDERLVEIQQELTHLCAQFRIDFDSVRSTNEILKLEGLDRLAMIVPLEGDYANLRRFLQAIEASDKFLVVESVTLAGGLQGGTVGKLQLNITVVSYFDIARETS